MKTNSMLGKILGVGGLVAALGCGCDRETNQNLGSCQLDINSVEVVYHQVVGSDTYTLKFGDRGEITVVVEDNKIKEGWFKCLDGRKLKFGNKADNYEEPTFVYSENPQGGQ